MADYDKMISLVESNGHVWQRSTHNGLVDTSAYTNHYHAGPRCILCGYHFCKHCLDNPMTFVPPACSHAAGLFVPHPASLYAVSVDGKQYITPAVRSSQVCKWNPPVLNMGHQLYTLGYHHNGEFLNTAGFEYNHYMVGIAYFTNGSADVYLADEMNTIEQAALLMAINFGESLINLFIGKYSEANREQYDMPLYDMPVLHLIPED